MGECDEGCARDSSVFAAWLNQGADDGMVFPDEGEGQMGITETLVEAVIAMIALCVGIASLTAMLYLCRSVVLRGRNSSARHSDAAESPVPRRRAAGA